MLASSTLYRPLERTRFFRDQDGVLSTSKREDDVVQVTIDYTDQLGGVTISSVAYADSGLTTSGKSATTTAITFSFTGIGETEITLTLSSGLKIVDKVRGYDVDGARPRDYA